MSHLQRLAVLINSVLSLSLSREEQWAMTSHWLGLWLWCTLAARVKSRDAREVKRRRAVLLGLLPAHR